MEKAEKEALVRPGIVGLKEACGKGEGRSVGGKLELATERFQYQAKLLEFEATNGTFGRFSNK